MSKDTLYSSTRELKADSSGGATRSFASSGHAGGPGGVRDGRVHAIAISGFFHSKIKVRQWGGGGE